MGWLLSWWKKNSKPLDTVVISFIVILIVVIIVSILGYLFRWEWTGLTASISPPHPNNSNFLPGKTLWDWLQLLIIPAVLAVGGYLFNYSTSRNERSAADKHNQAEREIAQDNQRETALQEYIDRISELLLHEKLRESQPEDEVRTIARVRTLTTLPRLDSIRKCSLLQFLYESKLIEKDKSIIKLNGAGLSQANTNRANLSGADLSGADLSGANLSLANLSLADLSITNLSESSLRGAELGGAILNGAILVGALLRGANLSAANLPGANLRRANLQGADLSGAVLQGATISGADLGGANMSNAYLRIADLSGANLRGADLSKANLKGAFGVTVEELEKQAASLQGATMPDGSIHL